MEIPGGRPQRAKHPRPHPYMIPTNNKTKKKTPDDPDYEGPPEPHVTKKSLKVQVQTLIEDKVQLEGDKKRLEMLRDAIWVEMTMKAKHVHWEQERNRCLAQEIAQLRAELQHAMNLLSQYMPKQQEQVDAAPLPQEQDELLMEHFDLSPTSNTSSEDNLSFASQEKPFTVLDILTNHASGLSKQIVDGTATGIDTI